MHRVRRTTDRTTLIEATTFLAFYLIGQFDSTFTRMKADIAAAVAEYAIMHRTSRSAPTPRRAKSHRGGAWGAGRQDRVEPADERDAGGDGAGAVPELVRGFRPRPRQTRRPPPAALDPATAALFPDSFQDSDARSHPERLDGRQGLRDAIEVNPRRGRTPDLRNRDFDHLSLPHSTTAESAGEHRQRHHRATSSRRRTRCCSPSSTLLSLDLAAPTSMLRADPLAPPNSCVLARSRRLSPRVPFSLFTQLRARHVYGTSNRHHRQPSAHPPREVLDMTRRLAVPRSDSPPSTTHCAADVRQINANTDQSRTLATLRDTLLPKLLSGELRVKQAIYLRETTA